MSDTPDLSGSRQSQPILRNHNASKPIMGHWGTVKFPISSEDIGRLMFNIAPKCEVCGNEAAISFACFDGFTNWKFCGACTSDQEFYTIPMADFLSRPASVVDWLAHMAKKPEMDWESFGKMMLRLREATGSKGGLGPDFRSRNK